LENEPVEPVPAYILDLGRMAGTVLIPGS